MLSHFKIRLDYIFCYSTYFNVFTLNTERETVIGGGKATDEVQRETGYLYAV